MVIIRLCQLVSLIFTVGFVLKCTFSARHGRGGQLLPLISLWWNDGIIMDCAKILKYVHICFVGHYILRLSLPDTCHCYLLLVVSIISICACFCMPGGCIL